MIGRTAVLFIGFLPFRWPDFLPFLLLMRVRRTQDGNKFFSWVFVSIFPMLIAYAIAIGFRILPYGITVNRYFVVLGGVWLAVVVAYLLISRSKKIQWISYMTIIFLLFSVFGPWSASSVSMFSQYNRLEDLLTKNKLLINGKIAPLTDGVVSYEDYNSIRTTLEYVILHRGVEKIQPWFEQDLSQNTTSLSLVNSKAFQILSLRYDEREPLGQSFYFNGTRSKILLLRIFKDSILCFRSSSRSAGCF